MTEVARTRPQRTDWRPRILGLCSCLPGAEETYPFGEGTLVFKVGGKMFALVSMAGQPGSVNLKVDPELGRALVRDYPAVAPGYHMNKQHWVTVLLDGTVPEDLLTGMVEDSYDLVVSGLSRKVRGGLVARLGRAQHG